MAERSMADINKQNSILFVRDLERSRGEAVALCEAVRWSLKDEILRILGNGVEVNIKNENGMTPLMYANNCKTLKLLIKRGADVNARDHENNTPLIWFLRGLARNNVAEAFVRILVEAGADVNVQARDGETAQKLAETKYGSRVTDLFRGGQKPPDKPS